MAFFKKKKKKKICVVGLDGVPYSLIKRFCENDIMPATAKIIKNGHLHQTTVSLPEISAVSWTSFATGTNPGTHGIFGFVDLKPNSYSLSFPSYRDLKAVPIWDKLAEQNKRSIIINQPFTYPAPKIQGVLISGFVALDIIKSVTPISLISKLKNINYQIDIDTMRSREDHDFLFTELERTISSRERAVEYLWDTEEWDYFQVVITGTDRLHHYLMNAIHDANHKYHKACLDYYRRIDQFIAQIHQKFYRVTEYQEPNRGFYILSDHGFIPIEQEFYLNTWLQKEGYLSFEKPNPESLNDMSPTSQVFALDPNRLYINLQGRFPKGEVKPEEVEPLKKELKEKLEALHYNGKKVVRQVFDIKDVYSGPYIDKGPDLIVLTHHGFDAKGAINQKEVFGRSNLTGMHTWDDAFFFSYKKEKEDLNIAEISQIILSEFTS